MKSTRIIVWICVLCMLCAPMTMSAKSQQDKVTSEYCKELIKEGWRTFPGEPSLFEQMTAYYNLIMEEPDDDGKNKYFVTSAVSEFCSSLHHAEQQALALGRLNFYEACPKMIRGTYTPDGEYDSYEYYGDVNSRYEEVIDVANANGMNTRLVLRFKDEMLKETRVDSAGKAHEKIYWDAVIRNADKTPYMAKAWCVVKMFRKTEEGYQVRVNMANYAKYDLDEDEMNWDF